MSAKKQILIEVDGAGNLNLKVSESMPSYEAVGLLGLTQRMIEFDMLTARKKTVTSVESSDKKP